MKKNLIFFLPFLLTASLFAEEAAPAGRDQSLWQTVMMIGIALLFFYFILWRPEQKRRKKMQQQRDSLSKGDRVTAMGIIGTIIKVEENTVILKMYDGSKIEVLKASITDVKPGEESKQVDITQE